MTSYHSSRYLEGGVDTAFVDVSKLEFRKKLYHIKGRRKVRITQTEVSWRSLNEGDVFVLECKDTVWCWVGTDCSRLEKIKVESHISRFFLKSSHNSDVCVDCL